MHKAFEVHKLNDQGMRKAERLAGVFDTHLSLVREIAGGRGSVHTMLLSKCEDHLELASFYAKKFLAMQPENQHIDVAPGEIYAGTVASVADKYDSPQNSVAAATPRADRFDLTYFTNAELRSELNRRNVLDSGKIRG
jgi:hypothetical protein